MFFNKTLFDMAIKKFLVSFPVPDEYRVLIKDVRQKTLQIFEMKDNEFHMPPHVTAIHLELPESSLISGDVLVCVLAWLVEKVSQKATISFSEVTNFGEEYIVFSVAPDEGLHSLWNMLKRVPRILGYEGEFDGENTLHTTVLKGVSPYFTEEKLSSVRREIQVPDISWEVHTIDVWSKTPKCSWEIIHSFKLKT